MLTFTCETGGETYPVEIIVSGQLIYTKDNLRIPLKSEHQDCVDCEMEIAKEASAIQEEARARVRAKKQHA